MSTTLGERLKALREEKKVTQEQLAEYLDVGRPTVAGYETKGKQPSYETLDKIADFFNVSLDYLLGRTDIKMIANKEDNPKYHNDIAKEIHNLSPESQEELKKLIELYKFRDMRRNNAEIADDLNITE